MYIYVYMYVCVYIYIYIMNKKCLAFGDIEIENPIFFDTKTQF